MNSPSYEEPIEKSLPRIITAPIIVTWGLASFLPLFPFFDADKEVIRLTAEGLFLVTGFLGALSVWLFARFTGGSGPDSPAMLALRGRERIMSIYAVVWLTAYVVYAFLK